MSTEAIERRPRLHIGVVNAAKIVNMRRDPLLRDDVLAVGPHPGRRHVRGLGEPPPRPPAARARGRDRPDARDALDAGPTRGYRCLLPWRHAGGPRPGGRAACAADYPGHRRSSGQRNGYFTEDEEEARRRRRSSRLAAGHPVRRHDLPEEGELPGAVERAHGRARLPRRRRLASTCSRARCSGRRAAWQRLGLEWLYRVRQEPRRLWRRYLVTNTAFCALVVADGLGVACRRRPVTRPSRRR